MKDKQELIKDIYSILGEPITEKQFDALIKVLLGCDFDEIKNVKVEITCLFSGLPCTIKENKDIKDNVIEINLSKGNIDKFVNHMNKYFNGHITNTN